jgi:selT/selW/selH-like putative selenoprotein
MCGGEHQAQQVADEIEKYMGIKPVLEDVGKGRFDVFVEEEEVWSKRKEGRFPHKMEIVRVLKNRFR